MINGLTQADGSGGDAGSAWVSPNTEELDGHLAVNNSQNIRGESGVHCEYCVSCEREVSVS